MGDKKKPDNRLAGLRRFAIAITILNVLGHLWFGFEQSYATPLVSLAAAYATEFILELIDAWAYRRPYRFSGGFRSFVDFLLSAHITGLAVGMLLYANDRLLIVAFGAATAVASKAIFRVRVGSGMRHYFNPSNFGITVVLLSSPWVGVVPPYHFTENLGPVGTWVLPSVIICSGSILNGLFTKRLPLVAAWLITFALQATIRHLIMETPLAAGFAPMAGVAFVLFTFYMVTDPATTPSSTRGQILFASSVSFFYTVLIYLHIVFDMFFALAIVCACRGILLHVQAMIAAPVKRPEPIKSPSMIEAGAAV